MGGLSPPLLGLREFGVDDLAILGGVGRVFLVRRVLRGFRGLFLLIGLGLGPLRASTSSRCFASSAALASASFTRRLTSSFARPLAPVIVIFCSLPVALSVAMTLTMPLASMSKVTSTCGKPRGAGRDAGQVEPAHRAVVARHRALALQHVDFHAGLVVGRRREDLALPSRDRRVARDQHRRHAAQRFDAERQRGDVQQQHVLDLAGEHAALDRRADRDDFVRVHALVRLLREVFLHDLLHAGHARRSADEHDFIDVRRLEARVRERLLQRLDGALHERLDQRLELRARQLHRHVLGTARHPP